jgi:toxin FitB
LVRWMDDHAGDLYLSVVTLVEVEAGIAQLRRQAAVRKAADLTAWLESVLHIYGNRILPFEIVEARTASLLLDFAKAKGLAPGVADIMIAATARSHRLTILTRNIRHFEPIGVATMNPFDRLPPSLN